MHFYFLLFICTNKLIYIYIYIYSFVGTNKQLPYYRALHNFLHTHRLETLKFTREFFRALLFNFALIFLSWILQLKQGPNLQFHTSYGTLSKIQLPNRAWDKHKVPYRHVTHAHGRKLSAITPFIKQLALCNRDFLEKPIVH
jgi:hypothetical protein